MRIPDAWFHFAVLEITPTELESVWITRELVLSVSEPVSPEIVIAIPEIFVLNWIIEIFTRFCAPVDGVVWRMCGGPRKPATTAIFDVAMSVFWIYTPGSPDEI